MSRVLSRVIICLGRLSPAASSDQPEAGGPRHRFCSVLLRMGFTEPPLLPGERWSLTPPFHPYRPKPAVSFCCTFLGVASTRRYLASCPAKPGLSSPDASRQNQPRLSALLIFSHTRRKASIRNSSSGPIPTKRLPYSLLPPSSSAILTISITTSRTS